MTHETVSILTDSSASPGRAKISDEALSICRSIQVAIDPESSIYHATLPGESPVEADSTRSLIHQLTYALYAKFHSGSIFSNKNNVSDSPRLTRDPYIERHLRSTVPHKVTEASGVFIKWLTNRTIAVVEFDGVRIAIPCDRILSSPIEPGFPVEVRVPSARPALSQGFCMIDGPRPLSQLNGEPIRRVYLHIASPDRAAYVWKEVLPILNNLDIPYRTKALSQRQEYPRRDAIVFYLPVNTAEKVAELFLERLLGSGLLESSTSSFAYRIGPGVALADEPNDPRSNMRSVSFGEHRSHALAEAAVRYALQPQSDITEVLIDRFRAAGIDPYNLAFNAVRDPH
ncbi:T3SS effector HopA1 family protein [Corynebacterium sp. HMSC078H07]|uniref:T3SS effector HopA1 family protein n=1 Tax=Corynebacterium sp. HMSC078H07 TaxID=1739379 RepID=UPI00114D195D|nr:T3SS effector HopA1 family protein [Corynebacterium sp. HMSC078H07]